MKIENEKEIIRLVQKKVEEAYDKGYSDAESKAGLNIIQLSTTLNTVLKCWRGTKECDPGRAIVRANADKVLKKYL